MTRPPMAHRQSDDWPRPRRYARAQFLLAAAAEALVLGLGLVLVYVAIVVVGPAVAR